MNPLAPPDIAILGAGSRAWGTEPESSAWRKKPREPEYPNSDKCAAHADLADAVCAQCGGIADYWCNPVTGNGGYECVVPKEDCWYWQHHPLPDTPGGVR